MRKKITYQGLEVLLDDLAQRIHMYSATSGRSPAVYGVPRGGVPVALALQGRIPDMRLVEDPSMATVIVDDLIDSGTTMRAMEQRAPNARFMALLDKRTDPAYKGQWIVFPWEEDAEGSFEDNVRRMLQFVGENPARGGLVETPKRVAKAWAHWCGGYEKEAGEILKVFEDGAEDYDQMVTVKDIPFYSQCEHHMAPFFGTATISYIPNGRIVGLSKLSRLVDMFARRLQVQERLTNQVADAIVEHLKPLGVGVVIRARHLCMESRGICQQGHHTVTVALRGELKENQSAREEFMAIAD